MKKIFLLLNLGFFALFSQAQHVVPCATDELYVESLKKYPELKAEETMANNYAARTPVLQKAGTIKYIPVVFHVIHKYGFENISQTQLNDAIRVLNEDFRKKSGTNGGSSTDPLSVDMNYEFRLAQFDPNGFPTNGVNRIYNLGTDNAQDGQKALSYWSAHKYFNVWVVNNIYNTNPNSRILGYAQFPNQVNSQTTTDGVMARADQLGVIEMADVSQAGRTVTHEAGHWVGLYHPFQGGCVGNTTSNCANAGDYVCDTPPVSTSTSGCPTSRNSCTNDVPELPDMVKNYMDYADGNCMNIYTAGQKNRADQLMSIYRGNLTGSANLTSAGINADGTYRTLNPSATKAPYTYGFNVNDLAGSQWVTENYMSPGDSGWQVNNTLGASGSGCMAALNLKNSRINIRNAFSSPSIDISGLSNPMASFYIAYAKKSTVSGDRMKVWISDSYGRSEILVRTIMAGEMETGAVSSGAFYPNSGEWKRFTIDLSAYKSYTNCRMRFELQSLRGNNIYFDEFSISEPTGISEMLKREMEFVAFPNPAKESVQLSFVNPESGEIEIHLTDLQGKQVRNVSSQKFEAGSHNLSLDVKELNSGIYLIEVKTQRGIFVHKLWVE